jgi:hypothetical protein
MRNKFSVQSSFGYRISSASKDCEMLSLVFRFQSINTLPADDSGLASIQPAFPTECVQATRIPPRISHTRDVDQELGSNQYLWDQYVTRAEELIKTARYNPAAYREWAARGRSQPDAFSS